MLVAISSPRHTVLRDALQLPLARGEVKELLEHTLIDGRSHIWVTICMRLLLLLITSQMSLLLLLPLPLLLLLLPLPLSLLLQTPVRGGVPAVPLSTRHTGDTPLRCRFYYPKGRQLPRLYANSRIT